MTGGDSEDRPETSSDDETFSNRSDNLAEEMGDELTFGEEERDDVAELVGSSPSRGSFLRLALIFEGGLLAVAIGLALLLSTHVSLPILWRWSDILWGLTGVLPMLVMYQFVNDLREMVLEMLGGILNQCSAVDLAFVALLAGLSEELMFRGVLEFWMAQWSFWGAVVVVSLLFGAVHALSWRYFTFATFIGAYFSWLSTGFFISSPLFPEPNLLRPIVTHAVYDFVALLLIRHEYRQQSFEK
ncbi:MAG: CPBP family intramembrane glutamic endopeptidase [Planctomycetaceae bacterium]